MLLTIITWVLVFLFGIAGIMKMMMPKAKFDAKMPWAKNFSEKHLKLIGLAELLGALGLILPEWLGLWGWLMPLAALGLAIVALLAARLHMKLKENGPSVFALVIAVLALYLLWQNIGLLGL
jgi:hypothetical protein